MGKVLFAWLMCSLLFLLFLSLSLFICTFIGFYNIWFLVLVKLLFYLIIELTELWYGFLRVLISYARNPLCNCALLWLFLRVGDTISFILTFMDPLWAFWTGILVPCEDDCCQINFMNPDCQESFGIHIILRSLDARITV